MIPVVVPQIFPWMWRRAVHSPHEILIRVGRWHLLLKVFLCLSPSGRLAAEVRGLRQHMGEADKIPLAAEVAFIQAATQTDCVH